MYEKFTNRARRVVVLAQEEARMFGHPSIGTEHVLLGVLREDEGIGAQVLKSLGLTLEDVRLRVKEIVRQGQAGPNPGEPMPFTPSAGEVLASANQESLRRGHDRIGTEHILLGLIRDGESAASRILVTLGAGLDQVERSTNALVQRYYPAP
ncbi:Clp protease N-terminal domain-containing protein [Microbispora sp. NPDC049633]|uniref:Clp protease N-terminal domain-containing protein n=1 Tax=Microbispora sp. NPDC049633 TaxID=3154355 RepID=UPI003441EC1A